MEGYDVGNELLCELDLEDIRAELASMDKQDDRSGSEHNECLDQGLCHENLDEPVGEVDEPVCEVERRMTKELEEAAQLQAHLNAMWPSLVGELSKEAKDIAGKHIQEQAVHITDTCNRELILTALALSWMKIHSCQPLGDRGYMSLLRLHRENSKAEVRLVNWTDVGQWGRIVRLDGMSRPIWTTNSQCPAKKLNASTCDVILPSVESKCIMVKGPKAGTETESNNPRPVIPREVLRLMMVAEIADDYNDDVCQCELCNASVAGTAVVKCPCCGIAMHSSCVDYVLHLESLRLTTLGNNEMLRA